jgi:DNA repair protein RecN (Recombination protein N)
VLGLLSDAAVQIAAALKYDENLSDAAGFIDTAQVHADEALRALRKQLSLIDNDPAELNRVENRLAAIKGLERKYGSTILEVLQYLEASRSELSQLQRHDELLDDLESLLVQSESSLQDACDRLHEARARCAHALSAQAEDVLHRLNIPSASLQIAVEYVRRGDGTRVYSSHGADEVTFLFSANKGEDLKPLSKIASGGELSRTLLALKSVLADVDDTGTLIFDEIDAGVSGSAAERIAEQLRTLGGARQVLCVTHSPQIAAAAEHQYLIQKEERDTDTVTNVFELERSGRVREVARLLGAGV